jgi:hypothetical protein
MAHRKSDPFAICRIGVPLPGLQAEAGDYLMIQPGHEFPVIVVRYPTLTPKAITGLLARAGGPCPVGGTMTREELREFLLDLLDDLPSAPGPDRLRPWLAPPLRA